jgi:hypothetical protein
MMSVDKPLPSVRQCFFGLDVDDLDLFHVALAAPIKLEQCETLKRLHSLRVAR